MTYNPPGDWLEWKNLVSAKLRQEMNRIPAKACLKDGDAVRAELVFVLKKTDSAIDDYYHGIKPDLDNLVKLIMDAATEAKVFYDDSRVGSIIATKRYPLSKTEKLGVYIKIGKTPGQAELLAAPAVSSEAAAAKQDQQMDRH